MTMNMAAVSNVCDLTGILTENIKSTFPDVVHDTHLRHVRAIGTILSVDGRVHEHPSPDYPELHVDMGKQAYILLDPDMARLLTDCYSSSRREDLVGKFLEIYSYNNVPARIFPIPDGDA